MNYNTDTILWENYGRQMSAVSPTNAVSVTINKHGTVGNGRNIMAQFSTRKAAAKTLQSAGFSISRQLGCGHVKTNLNARFTQS